MDRYYFYIAMVFCLGLMFFSCERISSNKTTNLNQNKGYTIQEMDEFYHVCFLNHENVWIVGKFGIILHSTDEGNTWEQQDSKTENALYRVEFVDESSGWISGAYGTVLHTSDGGKNWDAQVVNTGEHILDMQFVDEERGWVVGPWGTIFHTSNGGKKWESQSIGEDITLNCLYFIDSQEGWIGGEWGTILHTTNGGNEWVKQNSVLETSIFGIYFTDAQHGWAVGMLGKMVYTEDGGEIWGQMESGTVNTLLNTVSASDSLWSVGSKGSLVLTSISEVGMESILIPVNTNQCLSSISFLPNDHRYGFIVGVRGTILYTQDGGVNWVQKGYILG